MLRHVSRGVLVAAIAVLVAATPTEARGGRGGHGSQHRHGHARHHVFVGVGPWWWGAPYPYWPYYPPYYDYPRTIVVEPPPEYIQREPAPQSAPTAEEFWYYCTPTGAYYPSVQTCAEPWVKVPPRTQ